MEAAEPLSHAPLSDTLLSRSLDQGLWLEDRNVLLRWNTPVEPLQTIGTPSVTMIRRTKTGKASEVTLLWENAAFLNGLFGNVSATLIGKRGLRFVEITINSKSVL